MAGHSGMKKWVIHLPDYCVPCVHIWQENMLLDLINRHLCCPPNIHSSISIKINALLGYLITPKTV